MVKGMERVKPAASIPSSMYMKIWCNIQVIIYRLLEHTYRFQVSNEHILSLYLRFLATYKEKNIGVRFCSFII